MSATPKGKYFFAESQLHGLVLDICDSCNKPGTLLGMKPRKVSQNENQLWYEDLLSGTIRSKMNENLCLDLNGQSKPSTLDSSAIIPQQIFFNIHVHKFC